GDHALELLNQFRALTLRQSYRHEVLKGGQPKLGETVRGPLGESLLGHVGEGGSSPQLQGLAQELCGFVEFAQGDGLPATGRQVLETVRVHVKRVDRELVTG